MASPMSDYSFYSNDSKDFLNDFKKKIKSDQKLERHQDIIKEFGEDYERAYQLLNTFYAEAYKDLSYYLGNQWSLEELAYLNNQRRSAFTYNKIKALMDLIHGKQRATRKSTVIRPIESASEQTADIMTDVMQFIMQSSGGYEMISDAFKGCLISGLSWLSVYMDYRSDPVSGDIRYHLDDWNSVIFDPFLTKRDLSDCSFISRRKYLSRTEIISLIPEKEDVIMSLPWGSRDDKFTYMPFARQWGMQKLLNYTEYWKPRWKIKDVLVDMETGETREWDGDKKRLRLYREAFPQIEVMKKPVKSIDLGIIVEGELVYYGEDPDGLSDYPFVPFFAIFEPSYDLFTWKLQSALRCVRDPQTEINKRRSAMIQSIDSSLNSGWIAKTNSVSNPQSLYKSGYGGQVIFLKPEAQITDIQPITHKGIDPSIFQLESEFAKDMYENLGISPENVGMAENDNVEVAGILAKSRAQAGWIPQQYIFDGLHESQRLLGQKTMKLFQKNYTPEKIQLITKKQPTEEFYSKTFAKYNVEVEESILTDTQQQTEFIQRAALRSMGIQISDEEMIDSSNLHDKKKIKDRIDAQKKQAEQVEQVQTQMAMQHQETVTESIKSKALSDRSLAHEREAKIGLDYALNAERITRAEEEKTAGVLNLIKAVKELDGIDLDHLMKKVEILKSIQEKNEPEQTNNPPSTQGQV